MCQRIRSHLSHNLFCLRIADVNASAKLVTRETRLFGSPNVIDLGNIIIGRSVRSIPFPSCIMYKVDWADVFPQSLLELL